MKLTVVDALAPLVAEAAGLIELRRELTQPHPAFASEAMGERAAEAPLVETWSSQPVTDAHNYLLQLMWFCEDHLASMCRLLSDPTYVPFWALLPLARAQLEGAGRLVDLGERGIGARTRVERYMSERLFALAEIEKLSSNSKDQEGVRLQRHEVLDSASRLGVVRMVDRNPVQASTGKLADPAQLGRYRPSNLAVMRTLFSSIEVLGTDGYKWLAAGSHATAWEVQKPWTILSTAAATGVTSAELGRDPLQVFEFLSIAFAGYLEAAHCYLDLNGWRTSRWNKAALNGVRIQIRVGDLIGGRPPTN